MPGPPFSSSNSASQPQNTSPVMDMLNQHSGRSSPAQANSESKSPTNMEGRPSSRGRGGQTGFYRGGRGRGIMGGAPQGNRGRGRGGFQPGRPTTTKKDTLKFEGEYDFDKANEEFKEVLEKLQKSSLETKANGETDIENNEVEEGEIETEKQTTPVASENFYDKKKSFFDSISCESTEKSKGRQSRPDWKAEKKLNRETFGVAGNMRNGRGYRGGGRGGYGYRGGYNNYHQGGGYRGGYNNQGGNGGYNNQGGSGGYQGGFNGRFARDGNQYRGGRGRGYYGNRGGGQHVGGGRGRGHYNRGQED